MERQLVITHNSKTLYKQMFTAIRILQINKQLEELRIEKLNLQLNCRHIIKREVNFNYQCINCDRKISRQTSSHPNDDTNNNNTKQLMSLAKKNNI